MDAAPRARPKKVRHRREAEHLQRRQHILLAAERVFGRRPYDEATMQEIAAEAGIGMNGLYRHFPSKEELRIAVLDFRLDEIAARPAVIRGVASQGMLLAASDDAGISLLSPDRADMALGSTIK